MNPAEQLAALRALRHGLDAQITQVEERVREFRWHVSAHSFDTNWARVTFRPNPQKINYDTDRLLAWASVHMPHEVVPEHTVTIPATVRPTLYTTLEGRLTVTGAGVIDTTTGEVVDFATVSPARRETVVVTIAPDQKQAAVELVAERLSALTDQMGIEP